ncbi:M14 family zinc carboxypeptidase [Algoriphagus hitonicola]|uniref:Zinc carboxypeptidase n=1 Tax=Algoriphagus hitonicola TaxID=435880 RepID=A0A1I2S372_9BACT|nr:M14 family zinc carboxypeptidase [Algoriphagus hitonicola]SFG47210.1 Zinc carboxypeptidase [Algoriphagus hitonicola]
MKLINRNQFSLFLLFLFLLVGCKTANEPESSSLPVSMLENAHQQFLEPAITHRRFKHADLQPLIEKHQQNFELKELGHSIEGRSITAMYWGEGETKVMLWSQMHGNESTATMALFDLFNFLEGRGDEYDEIRNTLKNQLRIKFIPMINPDGAEAFKRRNALDIDLNRDAISQISPEAVILKDARDEFEPDFGFNLHDQQIYYNVVNTPKQATISVLAPGYNYERDINDVRERAMQTIVGMNEILQQVIPGQVGKYDDGFEPRAFGDNIQKWGTSTILIESGGYVGDPEKQFIRKLNFMIILDALNQIATKGYEKYTSQQYFEIPDNGFQLMDLILKEVEVEVEGNQYPVDIAIRRREANAEDSYFVNGSIEDLGDMQVYFGFDELEATGHRWAEGKVFEEEFENLASIDQGEAMELLKQGYLAVKVKNAEKNELHNLPILVLKTREDFPSGWMIGNAPNFFLEKEGELTHAIVNGYLIDLKNPKDQEFKQRVY